MRVYDRNFAISNSDRPRGKRIYVTGVCFFFFVIDKMPRRMRRVRWNDIVLVTHVSTGVKTGN